MEFERNPVIIKEKIDEYRLMGYTTLHFPMGTSQDQTFASGVIVYYFDSSLKEVYFVLVPYNPEYHKTHQNGHNKQSGETPIQTATRELFEETGLHVMPENLELIWEKSVPDNRVGKTGQFHHKYLYLSDTFTGTLFSFPGSNPIDGETAAPIFVPAKMVPHEIFSGHLNQFKIAVEKIMGKDRDIAFSLMNVVW